MLEPAKDTPPNHFASTAMGAKARVPYLASLEGYRLPRIDSPLKFLGAILACNLFFTLLYLGITAVPSGTYQEAFFLLFDLNGEANFPAWYSSLQLAATSAVLFFCALAARRGAVLSSRLLVAGALTFLFLSADECVGIHEAFTGLTNHLGIDSLLIFGMGSWIYLYAGLGLFLLVLCFKDLPALWGFSRTIFSIFALGAICFVVGAVGVEIAGYYLIATDAPHSMRQIAVALEEFMEMSGVSIFLYAALCLYCRMAVTAPDPPKLTP